VREREGEHTQVKLIKQTNKQKGKQKKDKSIEPSSSCGFVAFRDGGYPVMVMLAEEAMRCMACLLAFQEGFTCRICTVVLG